MPIQQVKKYKQEAGVPLPSYKKGEKMKTYTASGVVYGKNWGGGFGAYPASRIEAKTKKGLLTKAKAELKSGRLDSGMGFEFLKGARIDIQETETITIKGKAYTRSNYISEFIGDLTEKEQDFLFDCEF